MELEVVVISNKGGIYFIDNYFTDSTRSFHVTHCLSHLSLVFDEIYVGEMIVDEMNRTHIDNAMHSGSSSI